ncbi:MAG: FG-GAP-like repeat-containing protein [Variibacter sp.]
MAFGDSVDLVSALALTNASAAANDVATTTATAMAARGDAPAVNYGGGASSSASQGTYAQLADYLVNGYWAKDGLPAHGWTPGSTVTYNISSLTAQEQSYARQALTLWHDVANINFSEVSSGGQIVFDDSGSMQAVTSVSWSGGGNLTSATVHISTDWVTGNGGYGGPTGFWSYGFQTYLHELGHAMGLGHQGPYNGSATWGVDNIFTNDSWQYTVMSYFDQTKSGGASFDFTITPMVVDILAMQTKYGANTTTRTGDTTYGFNSTAGSFYNFTSYTGAPAFTIYDAGGTDTLDCSGFSQSQTFNMVAGGYCSVGGQTNNIGIALSTLLENAIGGSGADTFNGNDLNNTFKGNAGNDTINGGNGTDTAIFSGNRASYTLTDLGGGSVRVVGPDGTDTLTSVEKLQFADQTVTWPPVAATHVANDFDGDGNADLLLRNTSSGAMRLWELTGNHVDANTGVPTAATVWEIAGTGDFDGDGREDILWHNTADGSVRLWEMNGPTVQANLGISGNPVVWQIAGTADFDGDGKEDILWHNTSTGALRVWEMTGNHVDANVGASSISSAWHLESTGDFNGDGKHDLLWRNANDGTMRLWEMNGGQVLANLGVSAPPISTWAIATTGDFNGDGREDILWQNKSNGSLRLWEMNGSQVTANLGLSGAPSPWHLEDARDVNGDGRDDIIWRNTSDGSIRVWEMNGAHVDANLGISGAVTAWKIVTDPFDHA